MWPPTFTLKDLRVRTAMDPQYAFGLLVSGVAAGVLWKQPSSELPVVTCHCECESKGEPTPSTKGSGFLELGIICLLSFLLGAISVFCVSKTEWPKPKGNRLALEWPAKGKGKKGVYGVASSALSSD